MPDEERFSPPEAPDPGVPVAPAPSLRSESPLGPGLADTGGDGAPLDPQREQTLWSGRTDWRHHFGLILLGDSVAVVVWVLLITSAVKDKVTSWHAFLWGLFITVAISLFLAVRIAWRVLRCRYRLTGQRLFVERGILSQTIDQTELIRVDDVRVHRKALDRLFRLGTVEIRSTDTTDREIKIEGIRDPEKIAEHIRDRMRALRNRSLFIENL